MRVLVIGFLGMCLAAGAAHAEAPPKTCKLDGLKLKAEQAERPGAEAMWQDGKPPRPDLIGKEFSVERVATDFWRTKTPAKQDLRDDGTVYAVLSSGGETFFVRQVYNGWASPAEMGYSQSGTASGSVEWSRRSREAERTRISGSFDIYDGPLKGLLLRPITCDRP